MSLFIRQDLAKGQKLGIWHITESQEELLTMKKFGKSDLSVLDSFTHEQRKKEWLAARILTGELTNEKEVQILYDEHNKPSLNNSKVHISISHSHNLLAVLLAPSETGIDIEIIKDKILNIREKFMSKEELNSLQKDNEAEQLAVYWCAKESLYKLYGKKELTFKENLIIEPFQYAGKGIIKGWIKNATTNKCFSLQYEKLKMGNDEYMLAYVINQD